jgi:hypothetical protein
MHAESSTATRLPAEIGAPCEGGFYAGQIRVGDQVFALVVSPKEGGDSADHKWLDRYEEVPAATSCFDGMANTAAMAAAGSVLATTVRALSINGFTDWYLPSRDELELIYRNLKPGTQANSCSFRDGDNASSVPVGYPYTEAAPTQTSAPAFQAGGAEALEADWYWSSTQYSQFYAWLQYFGYGFQYDIIKKYEGRARAVRRFIP